MEDYESPGDFNKGIGVKHEEEEERTIPMSEINPFLVGGKRRFSVN